MGVHIYMYSVHIHTHIHVSCTYTYTHTCINALCLHVCKFVYTSAALGVNLTIIQVFS